MWCSQGSSSVSLWFPWLHPFYHRPAPSSYWFFSRSQDDCQQAQRLWFLKSYILGRRGEREQKIAPHNLKRYSILSFWLTVSPHTLCLISPTKEMQCLDYQFLQQGRRESQNWLTRFTSRAGVDPTKPRDGGWAGKKLGHSKNAYYHGKFSSRRLI